MSEKLHPTVDIVHQSPPVDLSASYDPAWVAGKTIVITGGASGFGEGFFRHWAAHGANVIIGDVNDERGLAVVADVRKSTKSQNHHYVSCNVKDWQSQVDFFREAARLSPTGGIDAVVANAGVTEKDVRFEDRNDLDGPNPPKPNLLCLDINLVGVLYTTQLAMFYLERNPRSQKASKDSDPAARMPDRHLLLVGSVASISALPGQVIYNVSKHGVLGLFRALRGSAFLKGIRVNMILPYFIATPLLPAFARALLAGGGMGIPEDVVDAASRLMADSRIVGRGLAIGPKVKTSIEDEWTIVPQTSEGVERAVWEVYADDFEDVDVFVSRFTKLLNTVERARGWVGWAYDMYMAFTYPFRAAAAK